MVLYGIKVTNRVLLEYTHTLDVLGESNSRYNVDKYACSFFKLIQYWRRLWHERTNGTTNIEFPFGFVQVRTTKKSKKLYFFSIDINRYE